jgi:hypothetical protein
MNFRKAIGLALIPALIIFITSCGEKNSSPIEFEKRAYQISCNSSGIFGGGILWDGRIWFSIVNNTGPDFKVVDEGNTEVSNADFNWEITNYDFSFDLIDKHGKKVASSSKIEYSGGGGTEFGSLGVTFNPIKGYEAVGYIAYLDGIEIASVKNAIWVDYPLSHQNIIDGKCENNDEIDLEALIEILPWCTDPDPKYC